MPTWLPRLTTEEAIAVSNFATKVKQDCNWYSTDFQAALADPEHHVHEVASFIYGYLEAFTDAIAHNPMFDLFELQSVAGHDPDRAKGYVEGKSMVRAILKQVSPDTFKSRGGFVGGFSATALLPRGGS